MNKICMSKKEFNSEHKRLLRVLKKPTKKSVSREYHEQKEEMGKYKESRMDRRKLVLLALMEGDQKPNFHRRALAYGTLGGVAGHVLLRNTVLGAGIGTAIAAHHHSKNRDEHWRRVRKGAKIGAGIMGTAAGIGSGALAHKMGMSPGESLAAAGLGAGFAGLGGALDGGAIGSIYHAVKSRESVAINQSTREERLRNFLRENERRIRHMHAFREAAGVAVGVAKGFSKAMDAGGSALEKAKRAKRLVAMAHGMVRNNLKGISQLGK